MKGQQIVMQRVRPCRPDGWRDGGKAGRVVGEEVGGGEGQKQTDEQREEYRFSRQIVERCVHPDECHKQGA